MAMQGFDAAAHDVALFDMLPNGQTISLLCKFIALLLLLATLACDLNMRMM